MIDWIKKNCDKEKTWATNHLIFHYNDNSLNLHDYAYIVAVREIRDWIDSLQVKKRKLVEEISKNPLFFIPTNDDMEYIKNSETLRVLFNKRKKYSIFEIRSILE